MSTDSPVKDDDLDNGIQIHKNEKINITRSDGVKHDLVTVSSRLGFGSLVSDTVSALTTKKKPISKQVAQPDDKGRINVRRSDAIGHDINAILRSYSEKDVTSASTRSIPSTSNWSNMTPKLSFSSRKSVISTSANAPTTIDKRTPSVSSKEMGYHPSHVRIVHMSDTFNHLKPNNKNKFLPDGNILVHSGNFTLHGTEAEFTNFDNWLASVSNIYFYRIVCLGHRDVRRFGIEWDVLKELLPHATHVLCNEEATILGIKFYSVPWHWAYNFNYTLKPTAPRDASSRFEKIPEGVDVLITHGPAYSRLDRTIEGDNWGSKELLNAIKSIKPLVHLHGHLSEGRGYLPAIHKLPLTLNSSMCEKTRTVMYSSPQVIKATQMYQSEISVNGDGDGSVGTLWDFAIDFLE